MYKNKRSKNSQFRRIENIESKERKIYWSREIIYFEFPTHLQIYGITELKFKLYTFENPQSEKLIHLRMQGTGGIEMFKNS